MVSESFNDDFRIKECRAYLNQDKDELKEQMKNVKNEVIK